MALPQSIQGPEMVGPQQHHPHIVSRALGHTLVIAGENKLKRIRLDKTKQVI